MRPSSLPRPLDSEHTEAPARPGRYRKDVGTPGDDKDHPPIKWALEGCEPLENPALPFPREVKVKDVPVKSSLREAFSQAPQEVCKGLLTTRELGEELGRS